MKRLLLATVAAAALCAPASAADLPYKAPMLAAPVSPTLVWYIGIGTEASVQQADVNKSNLFITGLTSGNLQASGGAVTATIGFMSGNPLSWYRCEATVGYQNITGANAAIGSVASRWAAAEGCDVGFEWFARVLAVLPNLGITLPSFIPSLPANIAVAGAPRQYIGVRAREQGLQGDFFGVGGSTWSWAPAVQTGYIWQTVDATGKLNGGAIDAYVQISWPQRGLTVTGLGLNAGGPPVFSAGASLGTEYTVGLKYEFGVGGG